MHRNFWLVWCVVLVLGVLGAGNASSQDYFGGSPDDPARNHDGSSVSRVRSYVLRTPRRTVRITETYVNGHRRPVERHRTVIYQESLRPAVILFWGARSSKAVLPPYGAFPRTRTVYWPSHAL